LISHLTEQFLAEHARQYGHSTRDGVIEVVNWKVYAVAASTRASGSRPANLGRETDRVESSTLANTTSVRRGELPMNTPMPGPLIIADEDSTTYVEDGWTAERDSEDIITLRRAP
jgi:N-methylhydantoinase A/oxoprolinase/acetone carboxylase beta subunit